MILSLNRIFYIIKDIFNILIESIFFKYFKFSGRASRKEFLIFSVLDFAVHYFLKYISLLSWYYIYIIFIIIPYMSIAFRRLHDFNFSGIIILFIIIAIILFETFNDQLTDYFIYTIEMLLILVPSTPGSNKYGEPPE
ncbi:DUF805 domain-containing protein [Candidatus Trichorickettsia mobilis]|uniref:DUF805 domain-containing protein n=1 Tax=Candidatus Trichorickettsia mobilis TaxID=1346319 RepID=A0ABZ0UQ76_9RICK|nr:DUF805 domain-containing protein [Candidatus Trichorickettsia mobilis]WPY00199.1 DUF805 domain-containing protein [Candidatus Trichorickettsia mobilis]